MDTVEIEKKKVIEWLMHPSELGKEPQAIEYVRTVTSDDGRECMIFKYKKSMLSPWLLAISSESGIFSRMEKYDPKTEEKDALAMLDFLVQFWKNKAEELKDREERSKNAGRFLAFVLLKEGTWDHLQFENDFESEWGIKLSPPEDDGGDKNTMVYTLGNSENKGLLAVGMIGSPVPNGEAEYHAQFNYMWKDAQAVTATHRAHIIVTVMGFPDAEAGGIAFAKALAVLCKSDNTLGVYYNDTVVEPRFMLAASEMLRQDQFPMLCLIWFGLGRSDKGISAYTVGLTKFGKDEIEIVDCDKPAAEIRNFLLDITAYVLGEDVILHDGETIGFTNEQRLKIVKSEGVNVQGESLKILY